MYVNTYNFVPHYLKKKIYNPVASDYVGQGLITLSYDDGRIDNYEIALPLHEKYGIPLTLNVPTVCITTSMEGRMWAKETRYAYLRGAEIASHTHSHPFLDQLIPSHISLELERSKKILDLYAAGVNSIAIPNSSYDQTTRDIIASTGIYKAARVYGDEHNAIPVLDAFWIKSAIALDATHAFETHIKPVIDYAVTNKTWCVLMMHRIMVEPIGSAVTPGMLESILSYIASLGRSVLLPANTMKALAFANGI